MIWKTHIYRSLSWPEVESIQNKIIGNVKEEDQICHCLIFEPTPVFTGGYSSIPDDLLWDPSTTEKEGIDVRRVDRGGKWTYHGPGQIVLFPIFRLSTLGFARTEAMRLMHALRLGTEAFLNTLDIVPDRSETPFGLYVNHAKLVSFGLALHEGICTHGLALYFSDQSGPFRGIRSCGVSHEKFACLQGLGTELTWHEAASGLAENVILALSPPQAPCASSNA